MIPVAMRNADVVDVFRRDASVCKRVQYILDNIDSVVDPVHDGRRVILPIFPYPKVENESLVFGCVANEKG